jgi:hypothetical protein
VQAYRYYASTLCTLYAREQLPVWAARHLLRRLYQLKNVKYHYFQ